MGIWDGYWVQDGYGDLGFGDLRPQQEYEKTLAADATWINYIHLFAMFPLGVFDETYTTYVSQLNLVTP